MAKVELAKYEQKYISDRLIETITDTCVSGNKQAQRKMFDEFAYSLIGLSDEQSLNNGLFASYSDLVFTLTNSQGEQIIKDRLPSVFYVYNVWIGLDNIGDDIVIFIANKTKSTAGLYFLAAYTVSGEKLYRNVLSGRDLWDVDLASNGFDIIGSCNIHRIRTK